MRKSEQLIIFYYCLFLGRILSYYYIPTKQTVLMNISSLGVDLPYWPFNLFERKPFS